MTSLALRCDMVEVESLSLVVVVVGALIVED
jgi:hypothetical protein